MERFEEAHQPTQGNAREKAKARFFELLQKGRERESKKRGKELPDELRFELIKAASDYF